MALSHPFKEDHLWQNPLSTPPGNCWCDVLGSVPAGSISSSSTLQILQDASHLWELLCPLVCLLGHFPSLQHVQGSAPTLPCAGVFEGGCQPWQMPVWASHVDISLFVANLLNLWIHVILIGTKVVCHFSFGSQSHVTSWSFQFSVSQLTGYTYLSWILSVDQHRCHAVNTQMLPWWRTTMQVTWSALSVAWWLGTGQFSSLL